ncbi:IS1634 family transposase [Myxosarcina sp. GI1]|uniref:IS1634 family transposase n=1 Tax=Myxosarcina sp. GI1 TaxID=1541065 RepID=UPI0005615817|nr:IS1634 family transposase [Myxosarcina sp. GI1]
MTPSTAEVKVKDLNHCGIIAGIIDEIGLVEEIDKIIASHGNQKVTTGQAVKAMIINGLGMISSPLYLFPKFFEGKATEHLLGEGILPEHLNDDCLGRALDKLYQEGVTKVFVTVALTAAQKMGVKLNSLHLDSSSFHVDGEYLETEEIDPEPGRIRIKYGYSRDHRPDLKQFIIDLMCSGDGDVPLYLRVADGNEADKSVFPKLIQQFKREWNLDTLFVADAALYSADNLQQIQSLQWLSRVPATVKETTTLLTLPDELFDHSTIDGYLIAECGSYYGSVKQRWLIVESKKRKQSDLHQLSKRLTTKKNQAQTQLKQLCRQKFACQPDAEKAVQNLRKKLRFYQLDDVKLIPHFSHGKSGRPPQNQLPTQVHYQIDASLIPNLNAIALEERKAGRFILATNVLDKHQLSNDQLLIEYKAQQSTERGFRFLKEPLFFTSSVFLKSPKRIAALAIVMGLSLLVYSLGQRALRLALATAGQTIPNQLGKPTTSPTLRWVFQCFMSVHLVSFGGVKQISNLTSERSHILQFFNSYCRQYYLLS